MIPKDWLPTVPMKRIIVHWTAGTNKASNLDREHYHILIEDDGKLIKGIPSISLNSGRARPGYAAHTLNCNTDSIGLSLCGMGGAIENPFKAGKWPLTQVQWEAAIQALVQLARAYKIAVSPQTILTHAEVQTNLGKPQRGKWDIARLPFTLEYKGAKAVGDLMRRSIQAHMKV